MGRGDQRGPGELRFRLGDPALGDEELGAIAEVFRSGQLTKGPRTAELEDRFAARHQVEHAVAFANGTVALTAMYLGLGIGPGDEVIVPSMTFLSSATSVVHAGATPVFADCRPDTFNLDPVDACGRITGRTKAILAVHYGGQAADMDELRALADEAGIPLLEDAAQAHGASYRGRPVGGLGRAAMFSFTPMKNITMGEGGVVTTDDGRLAQALRLLRDHGQSAHSVGESIGYNWRLTEMQAAIGIVQLGRLDGILAHKAANAAWMQDRLGAVPGVAAPAALPDRSHPYTLYTILLDRDRDEVHRRLTAEGVETRVYFPPVHRQPIFGAAGVDLPVTDDVGARMLSLPFHARLSVDDLDELAGVVGGAVVRCRSSYASSP